MFPDEHAASVWFEDIRWTNGTLYCPRCFSEDAYPVPNEKPMPYRCRACKRYFSVKTGTVMEHSNIPLRKWVIGIYLMITNVKGVSSLKLHRDLGITQKSAWFMAQRIREGWNNDDPLPMKGPVEVDETFIGGRARFRRYTEESHDDETVSDPAMRRHRRVPLVAVVGARDRATNRIDARPVPNIRRETLRAFIDERVPQNVMLYTDQANAYIGIRWRHESVNHSRWEWARGDVSTNGIESFWASLKRGYAGTYHKWSAKHIHRYVNEFTGRHNDRQLDTMHQMEAHAIRLIGRRLTYEDLIGPPETRIR